MFDLNNLAKQAYQIARQREHNGATLSTDTFQMLKHTATEVVEATDCYSTGDSDGFAHELSDVIMCCLILAGKCGIDIETSLAECHSKNQLRACKRGDKL